MAGHLKAIISRMEFWKRPDNAQRCRAARSAWVRCVGQTYS